MEVEERVETSAEPTPSLQRDVRVVGTRRPVEGMSNTYLCEVWQGPSLVGRWLEIGRKAGGVERVPIHR